jgi:hypothetical protein
VGGVGVTERKLGKRDEWQYLNSKYLGEECVACLEDGVAWTEGFEKLMKSKRV